MKLNCVKVRNSKQLEIATTSTGEAFKVENIFSGSLPTGESESDSSDTVTSSDTVQEEIQIGDWVLVYYKNETFPGEVTAIIASDIEVNVMHKSGATFWKWPTQIYKIFYTRDNILKRLDPPSVAGTRGQFHLPTFEFFYFFSLYCKLLRNCSFFLLFNT